MKSTKKKVGATSSHARRLSLSLKVRGIEGHEQERFDGLLREKHYLGESVRVGDFLRQVVERDGQWVALLVWGPAALKLKDREAWIGWNAAMAAERLKLVVQKRGAVLWKASMKTAGSCGRWRSSRGTGRFRPTRWNTGSEVRLKDFQLHRPRQWGACWLACEFYGQLGLDGFWAEKLADSRGGTCWRHVLQTLVCYRLIAPGSEWRLHRQWFPDPYFMRLRRSCYPPVEKDGVGRAKKIKNGSCKWSCKSGATNDFKKQQFDYQRLEKIWRDEAADFGQNGPNFKKLGLIHPEIIKAK